MLFRVDILFSQFENIFAVYEVTEVPLLFFKIFKVNDIIVGKDADLTIVTSQHRPIFRNAIGWRSGKPKF